MNYKLPEYEPSEKVWQNIENQLEKGVFLNLPNHEPAEQIWKKIDAKINNPTFKKWQWLTAACVLIAMSLGLYFFPKRNEVHFSEQLIDKNLLLTETDISLKNEVEMLCTQSIELCESPEIKELKNEFEELDEASKKLKSAMGNYNTNATLMAQLTQIENQKLDVLNKIAAKI